MSLRGRTAFITGGSRGIGLEIAKALAHRGASVAIAAKTSDPHPKLPGTIHTAAEEVEKIGDGNDTGAKGLAIKLDIRDADAVKEALDHASGKLGGIDILVNNASAISMAPTIESTVKSYDLMNNINSRGTWLVSRFALPHLIESSRRSRNPHLLTLSPPLDQDMFSTSPSKSAWPSQFAQTAAAYTVAKMGMSLSTFALSAELRGKVGVNCLWPYTLIGTSAMKIVSPNADVEEKRWRSPEIVSEAAARIFEEDGRQFTGRFLVDEVYLRREHGLNNDQIAQFSLGGKETSLDELAEDLYVSQTMRDAVQSARAA